MKNSALISLILILVLLAACGSAPQRPDTTAQPSAIAAQPTTEANSGPADSDFVQEDTDTPDSTAGAPLDDAEVADTDSPAQNEPAETTAPTETAIPTATAESISAPGAKCIPPQEPVSAQVVRVIDGDTILVNIDKVEYRVRYIGMNTPENTTKIEPYGEEATQKNIQLVGNKQVLLYKDVSDTDRYNRLLRFVIVDGIFVNYELVRTGFAAVTTYPPDVSCASTYLQAEREARENKAGLWGLE